MKQESIRWGLIGTGDIAQKRVVAALQALEPRGTLRAVAGRRVEQAQEFARRHGISSVHSSYRELLADSAIDAVYIATPVHLHAAMTIEAARAGKHVLCEKPMALTYKQCQTMTRVCRKARVRLGVAYYRRFYPVVRQMKEILDERLIGQPVLVRSIVAEKFNPEGPEAARRWLVQKRMSGGGPMMDLGCHRIDLMIYLLGEVDSACGEIRNLRFRNRNVEDHATATLSFRRQRSNSRGLLGMLTATHCLDGAEDQFEIYGTAGKLIVPNLAGGTLHTVTSAGTHSFDLPPHTNLHYPLVAEFNEALLEKREPFVSGEVGAKTSRVLDLIYGRL